MSELNLYEAAFYGNKERVQTLLQRGVHPDSDANENGAKPLYIAALRGHTETVSTLIAAGAKINQANNNGATPLYIAALRGHTETVSTLIAAGAKINQAINFGATPLYIAAENGHTDTVSSLIAAGAKINQADNDGATPLFIAAVNGHTETVSTLIAAGASINQAWNGGFTPLYIAAENGHTDSVSSLIAAGAKINQADNDGATPLYIAAQNGHTETVSTLIAAGAKINQALNDGATPLFVAAQQGHSETVLILIAAGANITQTANDGATPLFIAAQQDHTKIVSTLIAAGATINEAMNDGATPLFIAAQQGYTETVSTLITAGATINEAMNDGATPLFIAAQNGHTKIVSTLITAGAMINQAAKNGRTPLYIAAQQGHTVIVSTLVAAGATINQPMNDGRTPLYIAAQYDHTAIVFTLISAGATINQAMNDGATPLFIAAQQGYTVIVSALISAEATINQAMNDGRTPLYIAAQQGHTVIVSTLVAAGATINQPMNDGRTPLYIAAQYGRTAIVSTLVAAGATINQPMNDGRTPLFIAAQNGHTDSVSTLISAEADINQAMNDGRTPLYIAAQYGYTVIVSTLVAAGATINQAMNDGRTPLYIAAQYGHTETVLILIAAGADINQTEHDGHTPLYVAKKAKHDAVARVLENAHILRAARFGDKKSLRAMLRNGIHPDSVKDENGYTPLYIAAEYGHHEVVDFLIAAGAHVNQTSMEGGTPLFIAAQNGHADTVSTLISSGANIHLPKTNGATPLCIAAEKGHFVVVKRLLIDPSSNQGSKNGLIARIAKAFTNKEDRISTTLSVTTTYLHEAMTDGNTPLHLAAANGHKEVVELLISSGANIDRTNRIEWTPLFSAAFNGHSEIVSALILAGANINHAAHDDKTILPDATQAGQKSTAPYLLANNSQNGTTALYLAAENGFTNAIWTLLLAEADPNIQANNGMTPFIVARKNGHAEAADLLSPKGLLKVQVINAIRHGNINQLQLLMVQLGDPNIVDMNGDTLLHTAIRYNNPQALRMLLQISTTQVHSRNANNETPLILAIKSGSQLTKAIFTQVHQPTRYINSTDLYINYEKVLGNGTFGSVFKGKYKDQIVAVKKMILTPDISTKMLEREIDAMQLCRSPYVLQLIAVCDLNTSRPKLVLEYMDGGDLRRYLDKKRSNTPTQINYSTLEIAWVIANGLADIHHNECIHRDLKSQNILLSTEHYIKIADLGLTRDGYNTQTAAVGTICWTAPEVYTSHHYDSSADIYSFGVILTELDTLNPPYHGLSITYKKFWDGICNGSLRPTLSTTCSPWYRNLVNDCLAHDPKKRPRASDIIDILYAQLMKKESTKESSVLQSPAQQAKNSSSTHDSSSNADFKTSFSLPRQRVALGSTEIRCKMCQVHNSILNEFCTNCTRPLIASGAKVKILMKRLENVKIIPVWRCPACIEKNAVQLTQCATCHHEISAFDKILDLSALIEAPTAT